MISAGATPNEMTSTSESSSAPNRVPVLRQPGDPAVQHVEDAGEDDEPAGPPEVAVEGRDDRPEAEEEVAEGEGARDHHDDLPHRRRRRGGCAESVPSATTVTPARVVSPALTSTRAPGRQEEVHSRAEADHAHPLALCTAVARPRDR